MEVREARQVTGRTINVDTRFDAGVIESSISGPDVMGEVVRGVIKLQDQGVRDALKSLGWSDPRETANLLAIAQGQREELAKPVNLHQFREHRDALDRLGYLEKENERLTKERDHYRGGLAVAESQNRLEG